MYMVGGTVIYSEICRSHNHINNKQHGESLNLGVKILCGFAM